MEHLLLDLERTSDPLASTKGSADTLREEAAACRLLSANARTRAGTSSLKKLADHLDEQARKLDPNSVRR